LRTNNNRLAIELLGTSVALLVLFGVAVIFFGTVHGQLPAPTPPTWSSQQPDVRWSKKTNVQLDPYGYVDLPDGFQITGRGGSVDWWYGHIEFPESSFDIYFAAGTAGPVFEKYKNDIVWIKEDKSAELPIKIALARQDGKEWMLANVSWIQFSAIVVNEKEKVLFDEIVRSYRKTIIKKRNEN
jgi:hypothetical protein